MAYHRQGEDAMTAKKKAELAWQALRQGRPFPADAVGVSSAEAYSATLQADIPFAFVVKGKELPKGTYEIRVHPSGLIRLRSAEHNSSAIAFTVGLGTNVRLSEGHLVFRVSRESHVLTEVWGPGQGNGRAVLPGFKVRAYNQFDRTAIVLRTGTDNRSG